MRTTSHPLASALGLVRIVLALVALVSLLTLGSLVAPDATAADTGVAPPGAVLCHGSHHRTIAPHHPDRRNHGAVCPTDGSLQLPAVILLPDTTVPARPVPVTTRPAVRPPGRAPPGTAARVSRARDPPTALA